jgi:hypothetical protein
MPFFIIRGSFHLVGQTSKGAASGFQPDGDSMQFKPDDPSLLDRLDQIAQPYRLSSIGSTQLRFEGIDALELHFEGHHQPLALCRRRARLAHRAARHEPGALQAASEHHRRAAGAPRRHARLHPLASAGSARPAGLVQGDPTGNDGDEVRLESQLLKKSLNFKSIASGNSYPLSTTPSSPACAIH